MIYVWMVVALAAIGAAYYFGPKGWRTILVNGALALAALIGPSIDTIAHQLPAGWGQYAIVAAALINGFLRWQTTTPMGQAK